MRSRMLVQSRHSDDSIVINLQQSIERYRKALRRCSERSRRERDIRLAAESASHSNDRATAALCHDLRAPLNAILGWAQLARLSARADDELNEAVSRIEANARLQAMLISDILDLAKSTDRTLDLDRSPVDLNDVVEAALSVVETEAATKGVRIKFSRAANAVVVLGDSRRLQRVVWNLLTNAVKFTPCGGFVTVELRATSTTALLRVADTGCGIPSDFLPRIFDRYEQHGVDGRGIGLGLSIVRRLVEMHGGSVLAHSAGHGLGSTFTISLRLLDVGASAAGPSTWYRRSDVQAGHLECD